MQLITALFLGWLLYAIGGWGIVLVGLVIIGVPMLILTDRRNRRKNAIKAIVVDGVCPSCTYELGEVREFVDERLASVPLGPAVCPECGYRWPRMPPHFHFVPIAKPAPGAAA